MQWSDHKIQLNPTIAVTRKILFAFLSDVQARSKGTRVACRTLFRSSPRAFWVSKYREVDAGVISDSFNSILFSFLPQHPDNLGAAPLLFASPSGKESKVKANDFNEKQQTRHSVHWG